MESRIPDPLLREEIASAAHRDPESRTATAAELASRLRSLEERRAELQRLDSEFRERTAREAQAEQDRLAAEQARRLRPWIVLAMLALIAGTSASLWFAHRANQALKVSESQAGVLASMNNFLVRDLLGQSNPLLGSSSGTPQQSTLIDAIERVLPQIDLRFAGSQETAGRLHEAIAGAPDARTDYAQAVDQFKRAAESYRSAQGELPRRLSWLNYAVKTPRGVAVKRISLLKPTLLTRRRARLSLGCPAFRRRYKVGRPWHIRAL